MTRHLFWAALWIGLAGFAWRYGAPAWVPFLALAAYNVYRAFVPRSQISQPTSAEFPTDARLGELGPYVVDGDKSLGLFLELAGKRVFVDLREDGHVEQRKAHALELFRSADLLETALARFCAANPEFAERRVTYIGLHGPDVRRCEVFWEPSGHTALHGLEFTNA